MPGAETAFHRQPDPSLERRRTWQSTQQSELRDYRFYANDMLHPSELAVDYIWQRFTENFLSDETKGFLKEWAEIQKAINHRPFQPESEAYKRFLSQTLLKMERINEKFPFFDSTKEMETIKSKGM